jgi:hypothetical protein
MNALEEFHLFLDQSGWDVKQESDINSRLKEVSKKLLDERLSDLFRLAEIEREAFHFSKSPERRLSFRFSGIQTMEDGSEIPIEWPDISTFNTEDFEHLYNRFNSSKNLYAKTEYGLVLFYSKYRQDNEFVADLLATLCELLKKYIHKATTSCNKDHYIIHARNALANALHIANNRKEIPKIKATYRYLIELAFKVHQDWAISDDGILRVMIDFTDFAVRYFKDFKQYVEVDKFIDKNWDVANALSPTNVWGAIYVTDVSVKLCRKLGKNINKLLYFKAERYEKLSQDRKGDLAAVSFVEKAMDIYRKLKDLENLGRLQQRYQQLRTEFHLGEVVQEMPLDETQRIAELIKKEVEEKNEKEIVQALMMTPMIRPLVDIRSWSEESFKEDMLQNLLPIEIQDDLGNTVARYSTSLERAKFSLLMTYGLHMQIAVQVISQFFLEAFTVGKISAKSITSVLDQTWIGQKVSRRKNGREVDFSYMKLIEPGINSFFDELSKWSDAAEYRPSFVCSTDSLVLKAEYLLRELCRFLGIETFKVNPKQEGIIMEKTLENLLDDLDGKISADDHFFIKFILAEKAGYNLRNRIAHGLLDSTDYQFDYPLLSIVVILKISNCQFSNSNHVYER